MELLYIDQIANYIILDIQENNISPLPKFVLPTYLTFFSLAGPLGILPRKSALNFL